MTEEEKKREAASKASKAKTPGAKKSSAKKATPSETPEVSEKSDRGESQEEVLLKPEPGEEEELSEEELRRLVEESLEKVTVADIVLNMMNQLASVGYLKMGLPEGVNLKYRDLAQARLAIDTLEAMIKGSENKIPEQALQPFQGTLANLQMNYVQLKNRAGDT
jgi:hypothetical protein